MPMGTSQDCYCQCTCPQNESQPPPASAGDSSVLAGRSGLVSYGITAFSLGPVVHESVCTSKSRVSVSPSSVEVL